MWLDLIAFGAFLGLTLVGVWRGAMATGLKIASVMLAYCLAVIAASVFGGLAAEQLNIPEIVARVAAGTGAFVGVYLAAAVATHLVSRWERHDRGGHPRSAADRLGGGLLGAVQGAVVLLLLGSLGLWIEAGHAHDAIQGLPRLTSSLAGRLTQTVVDRGADAMLQQDDRAARATIQMAVHPAETIEGLERILGGPRLSTLQRDGRFWAYLEHGAIEPALNQPSFLGMAYDESFRRDLARLGLIDQAAASDARLFRNTVHDLLQKVGPRIQRLRQDPAMQDLTRDPEVLRLVESGNTAALLRHPKFRRVLRRVMDGDRQTASFPASSAPTD